MLIIHPDHSVCGIYALCINNRIVCIGKNRDLPNRAKATKELV